MALSVGELLAYLRLDSAQFDRGIATAQAEMGRATGSADRMAGAVDTSAAALAGAGRQAAVASSGTAKFRAAQLSAVAATERYNAVLADENATLGRLASAEASVVRANERLRASSPAASIMATNAAAAKTPGIMERSAAGMARAGKMALGLGVFFGAFELAKKAIDMGKEAAQFQRSMLLIQTNAGASAAEVKSMTGAVLDMAAETATKPDELANALYHVEQNGLRGGKALEVLRAGAQGAKVGLADVETTTNTLTIAAASGIKGMGNMSKAMGTMIAIAGTGDMRLKDLNEALGGGILSVAKGFGASLQDVAAVLATLGDNGIRGVDAAQALRQTMMGFAAPAARGAKALDLIHLSMTDLRDDMEKHGLVSAMNNLERHMTKAGVTGSKVGGFITEAFGRKAGAGISVLMGEIDRVNIKMEEGVKGGAGMAKKWTATQNTASFAFQKIGAEASAAGIKIMQKMLPAATSAATALGVALPHAASLLVAVLAPIGHVGATALGFLADGAHLAMGALSPLASVLAPLAPVLKIVGSTALGMWAGFMVGRAVVALVGAVQSGIAALAAKAAAAKLSVVSFWEAQGFAASAAAVETGVASTAISEEAALTSGAVVASGEAASIGWAGLAGPIGAAAIGVFTIISMFHKSKTASKEATEAAKAYTEALGSSGGKIDTGVVDTITKNLRDAGLPAELAKLNVGLKGVAVNGGDFVNAIKGGGKPLADLRTRLQGIIDAGTKVPGTYGKVQKSLEGTGKGADALGHKIQAAAAGSSESLAHITPAAVAAQKALGHLNTQFAVLTKTQLKDLLDTKTFAGAAASIDKVTAATEVGSATAKTYAEMMGITVDKNGIAAVSAKVLNAAVNTVSNAFEGATQTGAGFLTAMNAFSSSAGTAADRAALIGATLKAANGDALNFAAQMNAAAVADQQFASDVTTAAKTAKISTHAYLASIVDLKHGTIDYSKAAAAPLINDLQAMQSAAMAAAQATFQHARATKDGKTAADDAYKVYESQTKGQFIDSKGRLTDQARQLGLNKTEAGKLADQYFGMPKSVKTLIEAEGTNPVVQVLNQIGAQLAILTGHKWTPTVDANTDPAKAKITATQRQINAIKQGKVPGLTATNAAGKAKIAELQNTINRLRGKTVTVGANTGKSLTGVQRLATLIDGLRNKTVTLTAVRAQVLLNKGNGKAGGGPIVGSGGPTSDDVPIMASNGEYVIKASQTKKHRGLLDAINSGTDGYAAGGLVGYKAGGHVKPVVLTAISAAHGGASGIAELIKGNIPAARAASRDLAKAVNEAFTLKGIQAKLAKATDALKTLQASASDLKGSVTASLTGAFDSSKYADMGGLLSGFSNATATNNQFSGELTKLGKAGLSKAFLKELAAQGPSATLDTLAGASKSELSQVNKSYASYGSSVTNAGNAAVGGVYGKQLAVDQARVTKLQHSVITQSRSIDKLLAAVAHITGHPATVTLDGHVLAKAVFRDKAFIGVLDSITHQLTYGRR